ncbi:hypothetical protein [Paenibacillus hamazuiensis]|uniref:hypothetical protein n=1 Tax=Paenibacillus hamazuiensis TaxID=2936508 RepID=UPI00200FAF0B|nr:hypothetical protein [Paenibacillus hamazuiensis]
MPVISAGTVDGLGLGPGDGVSTVEVIGGDEGSDVHPVKAANINRDKVWTILVFVGAILGSPWSLCSDYCFI